MKVGKLKQQNNINYSYLNTSSTVHPNKTAQIKNCVT